MTEIIQATPAQVHAELVAGTILLIDAREPRSSTWTAASQPGAVPACP